MLSHHHLTTFRMRGVSFIILNKYWVHAVDPKLNGSNQWELSLPGCSPLHGNFFSKHCLQDPTSNSVVFGWLSCLSADVSLWCMCVFDTYINLLNLLCVNRVLEIFGSKYTNFAYLILKKLCRLCFGITPLSTLFIFCDGPPHKLLTHTVFLPPPPGRV